MSAGFDAPRRRRQNVHVQLEPPRYRSSRPSLHHLVAASRRDARAPQRRCGVRVGDPSPSSPGSAVGIADPTMRVVMFALVRRGPDHPIGVFASDAAAPFDRCRSTTRRSRRCQADPHRRARRLPPARGPAYFELAGLCAKVAIRDDLVAAFLKSTASCAGRTRSRSPAMRSRRRHRCSWSAHSSSSATRRWEAASPITGPTSTNGTDIDQQVDLGLDLAVTSCSKSSRRTTARWCSAFLGIDGKLVIIDDGPGQSLYAHLSIGVTVGDTVTKGQAIGRAA